MQARERQDSWQTSIEKLKRREILRLKQWIKQPESRQFSWKEVQKTGSGLLLRVDHAFTARSCRRFQGLSAPRVASLEYIETHSCNDSHQPHTQVRDAAGNGAVEAQPGLLYSIVCLIEPTRQPIGHCPQVGTLSLEALYQSGIFIHWSHSP